MQSIFNYLVAPLFLLGAIVVFLFIIREAGRILLATYDHDLPSEKPFPEGDWNTEGRREWVQSIQQLPCGHRACEWNVGQRCIHIGCEYKTRSE